MKGKCLFVFIHLSLFSLLVLSASVLFISFPKASTITEPVYQWTKIVGSSISSQGDIQLLTDITGNFYTVGRFSGSMDLGSGGDEQVRISNGDYDSFISKYSSSGSRLWTKTFGGESTDIITASAIDNSGNIYVAGIYTDTVNFGTGGDTATRIASSGNGMTDVFLSKYTPNGWREWTVTFGGDGNDYEACLVLDKTGNIYISGNYQGAVDFGTGVDEAIRTDDDGSDFVTKYQSDGTRIWTKTFGNQESIIGIQSMINDSSGNLFIMGSFRGQVDFGEGGDNASRNSPFNDLYITKYTKEGVRLWTNTTKSNAWKDGVFPRYMVLSKSGESIYVTGEYRGHVDFGEAIDNGLRISGANYDMGFISKYQSDGTRSWTQDYGGDSIVSTRLAVDDNDNVLVAGNFYGTTDFGVGGDEGVRYGNDGDNSFLSKYDISGYRMWTKATSSEQDIFVSNILVDSDNNVLLLISFGGLISFNGDITINLNSEDEWSFLLISIDSTGNYLWSKYTYGMESDCFDIKINGNDIYIIADAYGTVDFNPLGEHDYITGDEDYGIATLTKYSYPTPTVTQTSKPTSTPRPTQRPIFYPSATETPSLTPTETPTITPTETFTIIPTANSSAVLNAITISILGRDGQPLKNTEIKIDGKTYTTDSTGKITLSDVTTGTHKISYTAQDGTVTTQSFVLGAADSKNGVTINLQPGYNLTPYIIGGLVILTLAGLTYYFIRKNK